MASSPAHADKTSSTTVTQAAQPEAVLASEVVNGRPRGNPRLAGGDRRIAEDAAVDRMSEVVLAVP